jgi:hypothetical protein
MLFNVVFGLRQGRNRVVEWGSAEVKALTALVRAPDSHTPDTIRLELCKIAAPPRLRYPR